MSLQRLEISHFRNLHSATLELDEGLNIITGENAAGKTSLLEAIFYLSYGRSFRSTNSRQLIQLDQPWFRLIAQLQHPHTDQQQRIGIERQADQQLIRVNKQPLKRMSELASLLPVLVLHPDSHQLISAGPEFRRQFMDWGVFHVEHQFINHWKSYKTALSQRNAALRSSQPARLCNLWNNELVSSAQQIEQLRLRYLQKLQPVIEQLSAQLFPGFVIELQYKRGWPADIEYDEYLQRHLEKEREKGFTQSGPHRADIRILVNGLSAQTSISRGQQKALVALLKIAQLSVFSQTSDTPCILLYDDLPAELDQLNQNKIMQILSGLNIQLVISAIEAHQIDCSGWSRYKVFHVEQGKISLQTATGE
ncbi:MAG TPA: DNA replication/repair protein RecF [Gammaproteobacteria bacterium]